MKKRKKKYNENLTNIMTITGANMFEHEVVELKKIQELISSLGVQVFCDNSGFFRLLELISEGRTEKFIEYLKSIKWKRKKLYVLQIDGKIHQY